MANNWRDIIEQSSTSADEKREKCGGRIGIARHARNVRPLCFSTITKSSFFHSFSNSSIEKRGSLVIPYIGLSQPISSNETSHLKCPLADASFNIFITGWFSLTRELLLASVWVDDYVGDIGNLSSFSFVQNTGIFTIEAWIKLTDYTIEDYYMIVANCGGSTYKGFYR